MAEYEPEDSRNVTGTASTPDGRWTNTQGKPPRGVPDDNPARAREAELHPEKEDERLNPGADTGATGGVGGQRTNGTRPAPNP